MPLGAKLTQKMTSNAIFKMDFDIEWNEDLFKPFKRTSNKILKDWETLVIGND